MKTNQILSSWIFRLYVEALIFTLLVIMAAFFASAQVYAAATTMAFVIHFILARIDYKIAKRGIKCGLLSSSMWKATAFACFCWSFCSALSLGKAF